MSIARPPVTSAHSVEFAALLLARAMNWGTACVICNSGIRAYGTTECAVCIGQRERIELDYDEFREALRNSVERKRQ